MRHPARFHGTAAFDPVSYTHLDVYKRQLLDGASAEFDQELVDQGKLSPVCFGSALTNFGVETFLKHFLKMTSTPVSYTHLDVYKRQEIRRSSF